MFRAEQWRKICTFLASQPWFLGLVGVGLAKSDNIVCIARDCCTGDIGLRRFGFGPLFGADLWSRSRPLETAVYCTEGGGFCTFLRGGCGCAEGETSPRCSSSSPCCTQIVAFYWNKIFSQADQGCSPCGDAFVDNKRSSSKLDLLLLLLLLNLIYHRMLLIHQCHLQLLRIFLLGNLPTPLLRGPCMEKTQFS